MYLQARVKRGASVTLDEGTLTVKRQRPGTRFLFVEYPSLVADLKIVRALLGDAIIERVQTDKNLYKFPPRAPPSRGSASEW